MAWLQTLSGRAFSLSQPDPLQVDFDNDVAPSLAKLARFVGHTEGDVAYSVAQHCVLGAETLYEKTGSRRLAALFVLHDAHEYVLGDIATPVVQRLDETCSGAFSQLLGLLKSSVDWAIFTAAGVRLPDDVEKAAIKQHDTAMMNAERQALKRPAPQSWGAGVEGVPAVRVEIVPWQVALAREEWLSAFTRFVVGVGL